MIDVIECAAEFQRFLESRNRRFAFIGGVANLVWGVVRFTHDVDLSVFTGFVGEVEFVEDVLEHYRGRLPDTLEFALRARVLLIVGTNGVDIDVGLAGFPIEEGALDRSTIQLVMPGVGLRVVSAEDLILMKAFAGRLQDWADVDGIVRRQGDKLDWGLIETNGQMLAEVAENAEMLSRLMSFRAGSR